MTEGKLHSQVCEFLDTFLPKPDAFYFPVPNGMHAKNRVAVAKMKNRREIKPGIPDICIIHKGRSLFIELKTDRGVVSKVQTEMMEALTLAGAVCTVCRSLEEVAAFLEMTIGLKARVMA